MRLKKSIAYFVSASIMLSVLAVNANAMIKFPSASEMHPSASIAGNWLVPVYCEATKVDGFNASFEAQLDGDWFNSSATPVSVAYGKEATISITMDSETSFGENYIAINTDIPYVEGMNAQITSFKLDNVEFKIGTPILTSEGNSANNDYTKLRLTIANKWNDSITEQPVDPLTLPAFTKLDVSIKVEYPYIASSIRSKVDYGVDPTEISKVEVTLQVNEDSRETFEGLIGGSVIFSCNGESFTDDEWAKYNWPSNEWWGITDEALYIDTIDYNKECYTEKVSDYTYKVIYNVPEADRFIANADIYQVGIQEWGDTENYLTVTDLTCYDISGNKLISYDKYGYPTVYATSLTLDKESAAIYYDEAVNLTATCTPSGANGEIVWTTTNASVATVADGVVSGVGEGTAVITATSNGYSDSFTVTVTGYADEYSDGEYATVKPEDAPVDKFVNAEPEETISKETDSGKVYVQKSGNKWRFHKLIKKELLKNKVHAYIYLKSDKNDNIVMITSNSAYNSVDGVEAPEGYVYVSFIITDVPEDVNFTCSDIELE